MAPSRVTEGGRSRCGGRGGLVVSVGQGVGHHRHQLLETALDLRGEFLPELGRQHSHLEVGGVHVQLVAVQLAQLGEGLLDGLGVLDGVPEGGEDLLAVRLDLRIALDGRRVAQVAEAVEEALGPGVDDQQPAAAEGRVSAREAGGQRPPPARSLARPLPSAGLTWRENRRRPGPRPPWPRWS
uniref:Uncharacterized protein n=1 Tax=Pseudonaja textilis TaxID=8673 RepID=A0A670Z6P8_PSETE